MSYHSIYKKLSSGELCYRILVSESKYFFVMNREMYIFSYNYIRLVKEKEVNQFVDDEAYYQKSPIAEKVKLVNSLKNKNFNCVNFLGDIIFGYEGKLFRICYDFFEEGDINYLIEESSCDGSLEGQFDVSECKLSDKLKEKFYKWYSDEYLS